MLTTLLGLTIFGVSAAVWIAWIEPRRVFTKRYRVQIPHLKSRLTAVVIGDIQPNSYHWPAERLGELFKRLQEEEEPDLVLWLGDYYNAPTDMAKVVLDGNPTLREWIARRMPVMEEIAWEMQALKGRLGSYAILGNHDWAWSGSETQLCLEEVGITVLKDEVAKVDDPEGEQSIYIVGYEDMSSGRHPAFERVNAEVPDDQPSIALAHSPDTFAIYEGGPPLMLSGHTHAGQLRLPYIGPLVLPLNHSRYDWGWFGDGARKLYVTAGLGTSIPPMRFLAPPEVVVLDLVPDTITDGFGWARDG